MFSNDDRKIILEINEHIKAGKRDFCITFNRYICNADIYEVCAYYKRHGFKIGYLKKELNNDYQDTFDSLEYNLTFWTRPIDTES